ncbi:MAG: DUF5659 domain-containing protein [Candidatus Woykebacteria bacterium]
MSEYLVKDLYEAAYLYSSKQTLKRLAQENNYFWFVFENKVSCEKLANDYWAGKAIGNIKDYADSLQSLKKRLFAQKTVFHHTV